MTDLTKSSNLDSEKSAASAEPKFKVPAYSRPSPQDLKAFTPESSAPIKGQFNSMMEKVLSTILQNNAINSMLEDHTINQSMNVSRPVVHSPSISENKTTLAAYLEFISNNHHDQFSKLQALHQASLQDFMDLHCWQKDQFNGAAFEDLIQFFGQTDNIDSQLLEQFLNFPELWCYLKKNFGMKTFDQEEPEYPDHDHFFLTEDNSFLIEFSENFQYLSELKHILKMSIYKLGTEKTYSLMTNCIYDVLSNIEEELFQKRCERLYEKGMVDYFKALEWQAGWPNSAELNKFIKHKLNQNKINQHKAISATEKKVSQDSAIEPVAKQDFGPLAKDKKLFTHSFVDRFAFELHQTFSAIFELQNIAIQDQDQEPSMTSIQDDVNDNATLQGVGSRFMKSLMDLPQQIHLAITYIGQEFSVVPSEVMIHFNIKELYRVSCYMIKVLKKQIAATRNSMRQKISQLDRDGFFNDKMQEIFEDVMVKNEYELLGAKNLFHLQDYQFLTQLVYGYEHNLFPLGISLLHQWHQVVLSGQTYLNYERENVRLDELLLSGLACFATDKNDFSWDKVFLGISWENALKFTAMVKAEGEDSFDALIKKFVEVLKLNDEFFYYLKSIYHYHLAGLNLLDLPFDERKFLGGILLQVIKH